MEKKELVKRLRSSSDRREINITITDKGRELQSKVQIQKMDIEQNDISKLEDELNKSLEKIRGSQISMIFQNAGIRTGAEYLEGLRDDREIWTRGARVKDVTAEPGIQGGITSSDLHTVTIWCIPI